MFENLIIGKAYSRNFIAKKLGYKSFQAISRGVVTPRSINCIILFVTKDKQNSLTQYKDYIDSGYLYWEGEKKHINDKRIIKAWDNKEPIFLFYRHRHHMDFLYLGELKVYNFRLKKEKPSEFIFWLENFRNEIADYTYKTIDTKSNEFLSLHETDRELITKARIGQNNFRNQLIKIWGKCSVTAVENLDFLSASHIKPWKESDNSERLSPYNGLLLNPALDRAFDRGFISFNKTSGKIIISQNLSREDAEKMAINENLKLRKIYSGNYEFLDYHINKIFENKIL
jgi:hypothetical protein